MLWIGILIGVIIGALAISIGYQRFIVGRPTSAYFLNEKMIYQVNGQIATTKGENVVVIENAKGEVRCIKIPSPLPSETRFVKSIHTVEEGWILVSADYIEKPVMPVVEQEIKQQTEE